MTHGCDRGRGGASIDAPSGAIDATDPDGAPGDDAAVTIDAVGGGGPDAAIGVMCGTAVCATDQECCVSGAMRSCVTAGTCSGVSFDCDGLEDCTGAGEVCCYGGGGGGGNGGTACSAASSCPAPTCRTAQDCPEQGQACCAFGQLQVCATQCPGP